jgi:formate dehydrogenase maturation protein FdhE
MSIVDELRRTFADGDLGLDRPEAILRLQTAALEKDPPAELPEAGRKAVLERLASGEVVIPRMRMPIDTGRVAELMARLAEALLGDARGLVHEKLREMIETAFLAAASDDPAGMRAALEELAVPQEAAESLLREALKPEMLRTSTPLGDLVREEPRGRRCPLCESRAAAGTPAGDLLCSFCGTIWRRSRPECSACGSTHLRSVGLKGMKGAELEQCSACGEALGIFDATPDALGLSLFAVLSAPLRMVARVNAGAEPDGHARLF